MIMLQDARHLKNADDYGCCYMCHDKGYKPDWKDQSLNDTYVYDPGIEEFILDDNELSTSRFYSTPVDLNFDWLSNPRSKSSAKKYVKSVSIIDTLSELVSGNQEQRRDRSRTVADTQSSVSTPVFLKVKDVKNRNKKKSKQQFLYHKRLSSSLPLLNIPDNSNEKQANEIEIEARMSDQIEDEKAWRPSEDRTDNPSSSSFGRKPSSQVKKDKNKDDTANRLSSKSSARKQDTKRLGHSKLTRRLSSFERAHTPDWLAQIFDVAKKGRLQELVSIGFNYLKLTATYLSLMQSAFYAAWGLL